MKEQKSSKLAISAWALFDWATSAFPVVIKTFIFATFFTQVIAKDVTSGTHQWGNATALAGLVIGILSPILGAIADYKGRRKPWLASFTLITILSCLLLGFAKPSPDYITYALTFVILGTIAYEISIVFYNAMMRHLVSEEHLGKLSGMGFCAGYAGGIVCLIVILFMLKAHFSITLSAPIVGIWIALFSLPLFIFTPDTPSKGMTLKKSISAGFTIIFDAFLYLRNAKHILLFLIANMLYVDGLTTLFAFGGIYAAGTFGFNTEQIISFGIAMNVAAGLGSASLGWIAKYFELKKIILSTLILMIIFATGILIVHSLLLFWIFAICLCVFVGPVQAASRSLLAQLAPIERQSELFGLYALSGKTTAFMGPFFVGLLTSVFHSQRIGLSIIIIFLLIGGLLLSFVRTKT